jgi:chromosome segregation ATPase
MLGNHRPVSLSITLLAIAVLALVSAGKPAIVYGGESATSVAVAEMESTCACTVESTGIAEANEAADGQLSLAQIDAMQARLEKELNQSAREIEASIADLRGAEGAQKSALADIESSLAQISKDMESAKGDLRAAYEATKKDLLEAKADIKKSFSRKEIKEAMAGIEQAKKEIASLKKELLESDFFDNLREAARDAADSSLDNAAQPQAAPADESPDQNDTAPAR